MDVAERERVMDSNITKAFHKAEEQAEPRWYQFACCRPPMAAEILGREHRGGKMNILMLSATVLGEKPGTMETRVITVSGIVRCPFCFEHESLEATPKMITFHLDQPFEVQRKAIDKDLVGEER